MILDILYLENKGMGQPFQVTMQVLHIIIDFTATYSDNYSRICLNIRMTMEAKF